ncbi:glutamyl-tRNA reductase [Schlesneria paludicola]|uniref:glutamyl-tRNA reductase n=1 Tax=Schlesneria paludicola TaxID=360056 RepID=UPI00029AEA49|nr:glutamyl-tRNA reductase [Schlesneria paludicola]
MNLLALYCTHQTTPLAIRERLAFASGEQLAAAYAAMRERFPETEAVMLSTCNRVELYLARPTDAEPLTPPQLAQFLSEFHKVPLDEFVGELRAATGTEAVRHLFEVISSLDSMVLGEPQIVNQVREAYRLAEEQGACGPITHALFQGAIRTSSRVRTETRLAEGKVSIASVAVGDFAKSIFDHFSDKLVLVIGAGEMAEETLRYLKDEGVRDIVVVNRSPERAQRLAAEWGGQAKPWAELNQWLGRADVIVSTTGADKPIVDAELFKTVRAASSGRTAFILDLGAPRDFSTSVGELDGVFLYDIDSLKQTCEKNRKARVREVDKARQVIEDESAKFMAEFYRRAGGDVVTRLMQDWHGVSKEELDRLFNKLPHLGDRDREQIERTVERIVNKLLHPPLEALKDEAREGTPHGLINALKRLFGLND